jgi:lysozyme family protein
MNARVAVLHFDSCINHGNGRAAKFLQRAIGVDDDGAIGNGTLTALESLNSIDVCNKICDQREKFYNDLVAAKPSQAKYLKGWLRRIEEMRVFTTEEDREF